LLEAQFGLSFLYGSDSSSKASVLGANSPKLQLTPILADPRSGALSSAHRSPLQSIVAQSARPDYAIGMRLVPWFAVESHRSHFVTQRELGFSACCRMHISPNASMSVQAASSSSA
jgi:hypothetical protein